MWENHEEDLTHYVSVPVHGPLTVSRLQLSASDYRASVRIKMKFVSSCCQFLETLPFLWKVNYHCSFFSIWKLVSTKWEQIHIYALKLCFIWEHHEIPTLNLTLYYSWLLGSSTVNILVDSLVLPSRSTQMFCSNCAGFIGPEACLFVEALLWRVLFVWIACLLSNKSVTLFANVYYVIQTYSQAQFVLHCVWQKCNKGLLRLPR